jgi:Ca2+-binding EF-hand superfamily protein
MTDIVERLRKQHVVTTKKLFPYIPFHEYVSWGDAAHEIERLREALQEILREIDDEWDGKYGIDGLRHIARKALGEKNNDKND